MNINIRKATINDAPLILKFVTELAIYEKAQHEVLATVTDIEKSLFTELSPARALIASNESEPIGFAVYFFNYSTWLGKKDYTSKISIFLLTTEERVLARPS